MSREYLTHIRRNVLCIMLAGLSLAHTHATHTGRTYEVEINLVRKYAYCGALHMESIGLHLGQLRWKDKVLRSVFGMVQRERTVLCIFDSHANARGTLCYVSLCRRTNPRHAYLVGSTCTMYMYTGEDEFGTFARPWNVFFFFFRFSFLHSPNNMAYSARTSLFIVYYVAWRWWWDGVRWPYLFI